MNNKNMPIYIALGANLSNPKATFTQALEMLTTLDVTIEKVSRLWQSPSWPQGQGHPDYLNCVACVDFDGTSHVLMALLHSVENALGRTRTERNAPRQIDLDILDFRGQIIDKDGLNIPHPRMLSRGFVLFPLQDIARDWKDPVGHAPISYHIARLPLADVAPMTVKGGLEGYTLSND